METGCLHSAGAEKNEVYRPGRCDLPNYYRGTRSLDMTTFLERANQ